MTAEREASVGVKKLEWKSNGINEIGATSLVGHYSVFMDDDGWSAEGPQGHIELCGTRGEAKTAAQADYERRILSALEAPSEGDAVAYRTRLPDEVDDDGQVTPGAWHYGGVPLKHSQPLYTRPSPAASSEVTKEMAVMVLNPEELGIVLREAFPSVRPDDMPDHVTLVLSQCGVKND